ncbi:MAG: hypothetical protein ACM37W_19390 [Actinomycetota bacterium]
MAKQLLDLTLTVVINKIENILSTYPNSPYQKAFFFDELRQDLLAYVLSRVPNNYAVIEQTQPLLKQLLFPLEPRKERLDIEHYIQLVIHDILQVYSRTNSAIPQSPNFNFSASSSAS